VKIWGVIALFTASAAWAAGGARTISSDRLRYSSQLPNEWVVREKGAELTPRKQPNPKLPYGIDVRFIESEEKDLNAYLRVRAQGRKRLAFSRGRRDFTQGRVLREGLWRVVEMREAGQGAPLHTMYAVREAFGGFYEAVFSARDPWYRQEKKTFTRFLLMFEVRRENLKFKRYVAPEKVFSLYLPVQPWTHSYSKLESALRVSGPSSLAGTGKVMMSVRYFENGRFFKDGSAYVKSLTRSSESSRAGRVVIRKTPAGPAQLLEVERTVSPEDYPDAGMAGARHEKSAYAMIQRGKGFYVISYHAPKSSYPSYLSVFKRAYTSFKLK
jgi:hypothetical protein